MTFDDVLALPDEELASGWCEAISQRWLPYTQSEYVTSQVWFTNKRLNLTLSVCIPNETDAVLEPFEVREDGGEVSPQLAARIASLFGLTPEYFASVPHRGLCSFGVEDDNSALIAQNAYNTFPPP